MKTMRIGLGDDPDAYLFCYIREEGIPPDKVPAVVVCPGGAYVSLTEEEGEPVALSFFARGFNAFVLHYSVGRKSAYPQTVVEASRAVKLIRERADEWGIRRDCVALCGFSAGGHVAATLGTLWNRTEVQSRAGATGEENRPDAMILVYPCVNAEMLLDTGGARSIIDVECVKHVGGHTPPAFLVHTYDDAVVSVDQTLTFALALSLAERPFELFCFQRGRHGSLKEMRAIQDENGAQIPGFYAWFERCCNWLWELFGTSAVPAAIKPEAIPSFPDKRPHVETQKLLFDYEP